jgi:hypothetical protein
MIEVKIQPLVTVKMTPDEAKVFELFKKRADIIAPILGCIDSLGLTQIKNAQVELNFDSFGSMRHMSITQHFKQ